VGGTVSACSTQASFESAFDAALSGGGTVNFNCGAAPVGFYIHQRTSSVAAAAIVATATATTDVNGVFTVTGLPTGMYDVEVKHAQALSRIAHNVNLVPGGICVLLPSGIWLNASTGQVYATLSQCVAAGGGVSFGALLTGDVNDSNAVTLSDYAILRLTFGKCTGDDGFDARADLNGSGCVTLQDYALLRNNFGMVGPLAAGT